MDLLYLPVLESDLHVVDVLCGPVVQPLWLLELVLQVIPFLSCVCPPIVGQSWKLLAYHREGLTLKVFGCESGQDYSGGAIVQGLNPQSRILFSGALILGVSACGCVICGGGWIVHWYGLKLAKGCVGSGASWYRPRSATPHAWPVATWYEVQSNLQMVAIYSGLGGAGGRLSCEPKPVAINARLGAT